MPKLIINKLGPVETCELECSQFMNFTGFQASGKSTIAKAIYYFRTIKDDIIELAKSQALDATPVYGAKSTLSIEHGITLRKALENYLREKFLRTFGSSWGMPNDMYMEYHFTKTCYVKISLENDSRYSTPNYIWITMSNELIRFLKANNHTLSVTPLGISEEDLRIFKKNLYEIFEDSCSVVYIPAGRSMITLLSQQLSYIYATMDDMQKRSLDTCTKDYLERILRLKPEFSEGLQGLALLFYYLVQQKEILFIIEEPESHLFPESQKYITELIALVNNCGHSIVLTTHSPYVLGTLNNLLYAKTISPQARKEANKIIRESLWLDYNAFDSWFVKNGTIENCMDADIHMIQNEKIDEISKVINEDFERLLELQTTNEESVVL